MVLLRSWPQIILNWECQLLPFGTLFCVASVHPHCLWHHRMTSFQNINGFNFQISLIVGSWSRMIMSETVWSLTLDFLRWAIKRPFREVIIEETSCINKFPLLKMPRQFVVLIPSLLLIILRVCPWFTCRDRALWFHSYETWGRVSGKGEG